MEDKMDGVAEAERKVRIVADKILPPRPHHLTVTPNRKYPPQDGFGFTGLSARLQYMTFLSEADRGLLMTVPYFEIMDEPEFALPVKTVLRTEAKKKMSIKDYQNRKKSNSPTDATNNESSASADAKQGAVLDTNAVKEKEQEKAKPITEQRLKEKTEPQPNAKTGASQTEQNGDSRNRSQPKPDPKTASASETRKRQPDRDDPLPPQKRVRTDEPSKHALPRDTKPENARGRDATREKTTHGEPKAARDATPSGATNGRLQVPTNAGDQSSPRSTILVNGARSRADSLTSTPRKGDRGDSSLKASIPPLLSPLRVPTSSIPPLLSPLRVPTSSVPPLLSPLRLDSYEGTGSPRKKPAGKTPMKGPPPKTGGHSRNTSMTKAPRSDLDSPRQMGQDGGRDSEKKAGQEKLRAKLTKEKESQPLAKVAKRPLRIPPLLSPTLPPIVEAELARWKKGLGESSHGSSLASASESPVSTKKPKAPAVSHEQPDEPRRRSLIVKVKYKKSLRPRVKQVLQLPSSGLKKAGKMERSASVEQISPAKKRPRPTGDAAGEVVSKKSKLSTEQSIPPKPTIAAPTTPLKNNAATAMSRVLSNTSQANTPGDTTGLTPGVAERPPTSNDNNTDPVIAAKLSVQRKRYDEYNRLGSKLKRAKDAITRNKSISLAEDKRAGALHLEMVLSYMIAFKALDQNNLLSRRTLDFTSWESILPHFPELRNRLRHSRVLHALAIQIQAIILEELTQSFATLDEKQATGLHARWAKNAKQQTKVWREAQGMVEDAGPPLEPKMRANIGPGSGIDDSVRAALTVLRRWAEREGVDWKTEIEVPGSSGVNGA